MSTTTATPSASVQRGAISRPRSRMAALARAELTLMGRDKGASRCPVVPLVLPFSVKSAAKEMDLAEAGPD